MVSFQVSAGRNSSIDYNFKIQHYLIQTKNLYLEITIGKTKLFDPHNISSWKAKIIVEELFCLLQLFAVSDSVGH